MNSPPFPKCRFHPAISRFDPHLPPRFADEQPLAGPCIKLSHPKTAIHTDKLTGDVVCVVRRQEDEGLGYLFWFRKPAQ
jgi:hypothetical protein